MHGNIKSILLFMMTAAVVLSAVSEGAAIPPVAWKQSSALDTTRTASNLSNASGMDATQTYLYNLDGSIAGEPTSANNVEWVTRSESLTKTVFDQRRVWIVVDLGASYDLGTVKIWNFQWNYSGGLQNRGIKQFDVYVRDAAADTTDGTTGGTAINLSHVGPIQMTNAAVFNVGTSNPWQLALSNQSLAQAPNNDIYTGQSFNLLGCYGRFVAIVADDWYGGGGAGFGKVRFQTAKGIAHQPDPSRGQTRVETDLSNRIVPGAVSWLSPDESDDPDVIQVFGYNVYVDTDQAKVINATPASANLLYKSLQSGGQTGTGFAPGADLAYDTTYYWRVDAIVDLASVPGTTIAEATTFTGNIWSFDTIAPVDGPTPSNGGTNEALAAILSWQTPIAANLTYDVYFGTDLDAVAHAGNVDFDDLLLLAGQWLGVGDLQADRNNDNKVDLADFSLLAGIWDCPEFKGNQTAKTFNPGGLAEATQYYWRVDAVDASNNVYPGDVWTFSTYNTDAIQQMLVDCYDHDGVPGILASQKLPGYDPVNDPHDILAGQFDNTFNIRRQEVIYSLAFVYREPRSDYYHNSTILDRVLLNLDYICRAQAKNGGFNEKVEQGGWCGVALPNGGNSSRANEGSCTVTGFPMWLVGRSINMLQNEPAFVSALEEYIDNDGNGSKDVKRRDAYKYLFNNNINGGTMTGVIECMMIGKCAGGWPNQDCGALAAVQACNEAYKFLNNGTAYLTQAQLDDYRDHVLFDDAPLWPAIRYLDPTRRNWWTDKFMILENGHGALGYDTGYGNVPFGLLGSYAKHANDSVVAGFIGNYMNGYQYFYVMDDAWPDGGYWEWRTSRRQGKNTMNVFGFGISQPYHPAFAMMFDKTLSKLAKNPAVFLSWYWPSGLEPASMGELILTWNDPVYSSYVLPCNRPETFTYTDSEANLEVTKTGVSPTTVTWKAFNYDGATKTYTYEAP